MTADSNSRSAQALVELNGIRFAWAPGEPPLIELEQLSIIAGERLFISGASGSGKSTLLSLIGGVVLPQAGAINILGQDLVPMSTAARDRFRADHLGIVFQQFNLVSYLTILENVLLPCRFSSKRRERIASARSTPTREAKRLLAHLELDLSSLGSRAVNTLSIGQQQRVAVARALIGSPEVIIADEPTSALDETSSRRFIDLLLAESLAHGTAVIFVSHDLRLADQFDRHIRFEQAMTPAGVAG